MLIRRKNRLYLPSIISGRVDDMTKEEQAEVSKAAYWADNITSTEWPAVLNHNDCSPSAESRLTKKAAGWLMALARIAYLHPEMFAEITAKAEQMHREQIEDDSLMLQTLRNLAAIKVDAQIELEGLEEGDEIQTCTKVWNEVQREAEGSAYQVRSV